MLDKPAPMNSIQRTDVKLSLENQPFSKVTRRITLLFFGLYSGISLTVMLFLAHGLGVTRLECNRLERGQLNCTVRHSQWLDLVPGEENSFSVVESSNGDDASYGQEVWFDNGVFVPYETRQNFANEIDEFMLSDAATLSLEQDHRLDDDNVASVILMGLMFTGSLLGFVFILFKTDLFESETLLFDKPSQQISRVIRHPLLGARTSQYPLGMVRDMTIHVRLRRGKVSHYILRLLTNECGEPLVLRNESKLSIEQARDTIHEFLELTEPKKAIVDPRR